MSSGHHNWLVWQLADSAFPSGAFVHSGGLEAAVQHGEIRDTLQLVSFLEAALWQAICGAIPFVTAGHDNPASLPELDQTCDAFLSSHVANRASRAQGRSFLKSTLHIFGPLENLPKVDFCHLAPLFGAVLRNLSLVRATCAELFLFQILRGLLSAAVRLGLIGPLESQTLQRSLAPRACQFLALDAGRGVEEVANTAPLLEMWQGTQDRLYSRLFQT